MERIDTTNLREVSVADCPVIGKGKCGSVYKLSEDKIIKEFNSFITEDDVLGEYACSLNASKVFEGAARVYELVKLNDGYGIIYECLNGDDLEKFFANNPEKVGEYSEKMGILLRQMHRSEISGVEIKKAKVEFYNRLEYAKDYIISLSDEKTYKKILSIIDNVPDKEIYLHGDYHADNILMVNGVLRPIDMADNMVGHPIFDFLTTYALRVRLYDCFNDVLNSLKTYTGDDKDMLEKVLNREKQVAYSPEKSKLFWNGLIRGYLNTDDAEKIKKVTESARYFSAFSLVTSKRSESFLGEYMTKIFTKRGIENLMDEYDSFDMSLLDSML